MTFSLIDLIASLAVVGLCAGIAYFGGFHRRARLRRALQSLPRRYSILAPLASAALALLTCVTSGASAGTPADISSRALVFFVCLLAALTAQGVLLVLLWLPLSLRAHAVPVFSSHGRDQLPRRTTWLLVMTHLLAYVLISITFSRWLYFIFPTAVLEVVFGNKASLASLGTQTSWFFGLSVFLASCATRFPTVLRGERTSILHRGVFLAFLVVELLVIMGIVLVQWWTYCLFYAGFVNPLAVLAAMPEVLVQPYSVAFEAFLAHPGDHFARALGDLLPHLTATMAPTIWIIVWSIIPKRLMSIILADVADHQNRYELRWRYRDIYRAKLISAVIEENPLFLVIGFLFVVCLLAVPLLLMHFNRADLLDDLVGTDQFLAAFALVSAVVSPFFVNSSQPEVVLSSLFYRELRTAITSMKSHVVLLGGNDVGARLLQEELRAITPLRSVAPNPHDFDKVVTPDLDVEYFCKRLLLIQADTDSLSFSAEADDLGVYGVVQHRDPRRPASSTAEREDFLIPALSGLALTAATASRANVEHASYLVNTVANDTNVTAAIAQLEDTKTAGSICVARNSDIHAMVDLVGALPIQLVYTKHNTGMQLGLSLYAHYRYHLLRSGRHPRILLVGKDTANYYMLSEFFHRVAAEYNTRGVYLARNIVARTVAAVLIGDDHPSVHARRQRFLQFAPRCFDSEWRLVLARHGRSAPGAPPASDVAIPTISTDVVSWVMLRECIRSFAPQIVVVSHDGAVYGDALLRDVLGIVESEATENQAAAPSVIYSPTITPDRRQRELLYARELLAAYEARWAGDARAPRTQLVDEHSDTIAMIHAVRAAFGTRHNAGE